MLHTFDENLSEETAPPIGSHPGEGEATPAADWDAILAFCRDIIGSNIHLCSIPQEGGAPSGKWFGSDAEAAADWAVRENAANRNVYWTVNRARSGQDKKPRKADIESARWCHVDIDPPFEPEAKRAELTSLELPPTLIVHSGNGLQALWRLDGEHDDLVAVEHVNAALAARLGGDKCQNIDRLLRVPGTVNYPDAGKRAKGRVPRQARLEHYDDGASYQFTALEHAFGRSPATSSRSHQGPIMTGTRNTYLTSRAGTLRRQGLDEAQLESELQGINLAECNPPLESREVAAIARSIARYPAGRNPDQFETNSDGKFIKNSPHNVRVALRQLGVVVRYDQFKGRNQVAGIPEWPDSELDDAAMNRLRMLVDERFGLLVPEATFRQTVEDVARQNAFHPVRDYLDGLQWDGTPRLDSWLTTYAQAQDSEFVRAVAAIVLIAAVRRVRQPGVKFDTMLVLEGGQGSSKSSLLATLATQREWFNDNAPLAASAREAMEQLQGRWIVEIAELADMTRRQVEDVKAFLSRSTDRARAAYARYVTDVARQCILVGTTNNEQYLRDETGNRRFWPVKVGTIDLEALARDRDQLWAEAAAREARGESITLPEHLWEAARAEQNQRLVTTPVHEVLADALDGIEGRVAKCQVYRALNLADDVVRQRAVGPDVNAAMTRLGWRPTRFRQTPTDNPVHGFEKGDSKQVYQWLLDRFVPIDAPGVLRVCR